MMSIDHPGWVKVAWWLLGTAQQLLAPWLGTCSLAMLSAEVPLIQLVRLGAYSCLDVPRRSPSHFDLPRVVNRHHYCNP